MGSSQVLTGQGLLELLVTWRFARNLYLDGRVLKNVLNFSCESQRLTITSLKHWTGRKAVCVKFSLKIVTQSSPTLPNVLTGTSDRSKELRSCMPTLAWETTQMRNYIYWKTSPNLPIFISKVVDKIRNTGAATKVCTMQAEADKM